MATRGSNAKIKATKIISDAFGADFVGEYDKKLIVWCDDGGERVQLAITMTCPKTFVGEDLPIKENAAPSSYVPVSRATAQISDAEKANIDFLMKKFDL